MDNKAQHSKLLEQLKTACQNKEWKTYAQILERLKHAKADMCQHGRAINTACASCDSVEEELYCD